MNKVFEIPVKEFFFFSVYHTPGYICDYSECNTLEIFDISLSKLPSRNSIFIYLVNNDDKIIFFALYIYLIYMFIVWKGKHY